MGQALSLAGVPLVAFLREFLHDPRHGRWLLLGSVMLCSAAAAWFWLRYLSDPLANEQRHVSAGWYEIAGLGTYGLLLAAIPARLMSVVRWCCSRAARHLT